MTKAIKIGNNNSSITNLEGLKIYDAIPQRNSEISTNFINFNVLNASTVNALADLMNSTNKS